MSTSNTHPCHPECNRGIPLGQEKWGSTGRNIRTFLSVSSLTWWAARDVSTSLSLRSTWQDSSPSVMKGWRSVRAESRGSLSRKIVWFTLVELIVVITILVILGTIAFVSLGGFSGSARDSSRVSDLSLIGKGLDIHYTKLWFFPVPTSSTGITFGSSSSVVWYQGTIGEWVIRSLGWAWARISTKPVDPLSKEEYRYSLPTGVNEYLLAADYEGDSVAYEEIPPTPLHKGGENVASLTSTSASIFLDPLMKGVTNEESRGILWLDSVSASTWNPTLSYLKGTYNGVATRVSSGSTINIIALPSIFLSSGSTGTIVDASSRNFLLQGKTLSGVSFAPKVVYSSGALPGNDTERLLFSSGIVAAYSGTSLATNSDIKSFIDNVNSTGSLSAVGGNFVRNKFGGNGPSIVATASSASSSYNVGNSLMFNSTLLNSSSNPHLGRNFASAWNRTKWTFSAWVKRASLSIPTHGNTLLAQNTWGNDYLWFDAGIYSDKLGYYDANSGIDIRTSAVFRDLSAWYHVVLTIDTNTGANDRAIIYVNGQRQSLSTNTQPWAWVSTYFNSSGINYLWMQAVNYANSFDGYLSEVNFVDSWALDASAFGQFDSTTGQWTPKAYTGDYGVNGFHLDFSSGATVQSLGSDSAPISGGHTVKNDWTVNNMSVAGNQVIDSPSNNFATLNPLQKTATYAWITNGNLTLTSLTSGQYASALSTLPVSESGTYWEYIVPSRMNGGIQLSDPGWNPNQNSYPWASGGTPVGWHFGPGAATGPTSLQYRTISGGWNSTLTNLVSPGSTLRFAYRNGMVWVGVDSTWSGDPVAWTWPLYSGLPSGLFVSLSDYYDGIWPGGGTLNFGQGWQAGLIYSSSAGGYFKYIPPTGFKALSTANLPDPAVKNPKQHFDILTWVGNAAGSRSLTGLALQPDLVWIKDRTTGTSHTIYDTLRGFGALKALSSSSTANEGSIAASNEGYLNGVISGGLDLIKGTDVNSYANKLNDNYVAWNWKKWSGVGANGPWLDIVKWTVGASGGAWQVVGHSLGTTPKFIIEKNLSASSSWLVYHQNMNASPLTGYMDLQTAASFSPFAFWSNIDANNITRAWNLTTGADWISYLWSEVPWFSKFGSFSATQNTFVYTGFKPRYLLIRSSTNTASWDIVDTTQNPYNPAQSRLYADLAAIPGNFSNGIDFLSNGFVVRETTGGDVNSGTVIYAAFAEAPFKYATAR